jgi:hypothetical protein
MAQSLEVLDGDRTGKTPPAPWINVGRPYWSGLNIGAIEKNYGVAYIGDFAIKDGKGNWTEAPMAVFYQASPDLAKGHSNYMGVFVRGGGVFFCNAGIVGEIAWNGVISADGEILISTYRHDFRQSADGTAMVDGGQDYCRYSGERVQVCIDGASMARTRVERRMMMLGVTPATSEDASPNAGQSPGLLAATL